MNTPQHLNDTVYAKLAPSPIHGIGVFAIRDMPEGTRVTDFYGPQNVSDFLYHMDEYDFFKILPEIRALILDRMTFEEGTRLTFTSPNASQILQAFMNHSDTPNTDGKRTVRDVKAGEELTEDFHTLATRIHPLSREHMPFL